MTPLILWSSEGRPLREFPFWLPFVLRLNFSSSTLTMTTLLRFETLDVVFSTLASSGVLFATYFGCHWWFCRRRLRRCGCPFVCCAPCPLALALVGRPGERATSLASAPSSAAVVVLPVHCVPRTSWVCLLLWHAGSCPCDEAAVTSCC